MRLIQKSKGITLIALVITIIVLLILAGVSIATLGGENGIISRARKAKTTTEEKQAEEEAVLLVNEYEMYKKMCETEGKEPNIGEFLEKNYKDKYKVEDGKYKIETESGENLEIDDKGNVKLKDDDNVSYSLLASKVKVGDFVNYDAGNWSSTADKPNSQGQFGGYTSETSKNASITPYSNYANTYSGGWRVLSVSDNIVTIVHAGTPVSYYHNYTNGGHANETVNKLNTFCNNNFVNNKYASSSRSIRKSDSSSVLQTGSYYWFADVQNNNNVWNWDPVSATGQYAGSPKSAFQGSFGVRPVVVLKAEVKTTGTASNGYGQTGYNITI